jgi:hypothetical protein
MFALSKAVRGVSCRAAWQVACRVGSAMAPLPPPFSGAIAHDNTPGGSESPRCCVWGISGQVAAGYGVRAASTVEPGPQVFVFDEPAA